MSEGIVGTGTPRGSSGLERALGSFAVPVVASPERFPDGAHLRVEIPSVESPAAMRAVLDEADRRDLVVHRVSQGSGAMLLSDSELREMASMGADRGVEVNLFIGPREEFGVGATVRVEDGRALAGHLRGLHQLRYAVEDVARAVEAGIRGFLVADYGLLEVLVTLVEAGELPELVFKTSAVLAPSNPASFRQLADLGATTINVPSDVTLVELAEIAPRSRRPRSTSTSRRPTPWAASCAATRSPRSPWWPRRSTPSTDCATRERSTRPGPRSSATSSRTSSRRSGAPRSRASGSSAPASTSSSPSPAPKASGSPVA